MKYFYLTKTSKDQASTSSSAITASVKSWIAGSSSPELKNHLTPLTRHIPRLFDLVDQLMKEKLSESQFPFLSSSSSSELGEK